MLQEVFLNLIRQYSSDTGLAKKLWEEIEKAYAGKGRHYHTLDHLDFLLTQLTDVKSSVTSWNILLFTLYYHDFVYSVTRKDNEERSADAAAERMGFLDIPAADIAACRKQILATRSHEENQDADTRFFLDADLAILGSSPVKYRSYCAQVRKEYSIFPGILYNAGRKKVLSAYLNREWIYQTEYFYEKFELQARENIQRELSGIGGKLEVSSE